MHPPTNPQPLSPGDPRVLAYTITGAVKASGLSRTRIYHAIADGDLKAVKAGRRTLIPADSLEMLLANLPEAEIGKAAKIAALEAGHES